MELFLRFMFSKLNFIVTNFDRIQIASRLLPGIYVRTCVCVCFVYIFVYVSTHRAPTTKYGDEKIHCVTKCRANGRNGIPMLPKGKDEKKMVWNNFALFSAVKMEIMCIKQLIRTQQSIDRSSCRRPSARNTYITNK